LLSPIHLGNIFRKKLLTWMQTRYTFMIAIHKGRIAECDLARPSVDSRIMTGSRPTNLMLRCDSAFAETGIPWRGTPKR
jgi:hypothetical protein